MNDETKQKVNDLLNLELSGSDKELFEKTWETLMLIPLGLTEVQKPSLKRMMEIAYITGFLAHSVKCKAEQA